MCWKFDNVLFIKAKLVTETRPNLCLIANLNTKARIQISMFKSEPIHIHANSILAVRADTGTSMAFNVIDTIQGQDLVENFYADQFFKTMVTPKNDSIKEIWDNLLLLATTNYRNLSYENDKIRVRLNTSLGYLMVIDKSENDEILISIAFDDDPHQRHMKHSSVIVKTNAFWTTMDTLCMFRQDGNNLFEKIYVLSDSVLIKSFKFMNGTLFKNDGFLASVLSGRVNDVEDYTFY